jgi:EKC/KEOPS complex subunit CGI121/TPRKB
MQYYLCLMIINLTLAQIAESFRRFGVLGTTTSLLAVKVLDESNPSSPDPSIHLSSSVEGMRLAFNDTNLKEGADLPRVRKIYKLNPSAGSGGSNGKRAKGGHGSSSTVTNKQTNGTIEGLHEIKEMEAVILGIMALKGS